MKKGQRGFTLLELLVVIAIIGILSAIVLVSLNISRAKAKTSVVKSQMDSIRLASYLAYIDDVGYGLASSVGGCEGMINNPAFGDLMSSSSWPIIDGVSITPICYSNASSTGSIITAFSMWHALAAGGGWCVDSTGKAISKDAPPNSADCGEADIMPSESLSCTPNQTGYVITGNVTPDVTGNYYQNGTLNGQPVYSRGTGTYYISYSSSALFWYIGTTPGNGSGASFFRSTGPDGDYYAVNGGSGIANISYSNCLPVVSLAALDICTHSATDLNCWSVDPIISTLWSWPSTAATLANSPTDGFANTAAMVNLNVVYPPAVACLNLTEGDYHDWYLPASEQLVSAYNAGIIGFQAGYHWSSTETSSSSAWSVNFPSGELVSDSKDYKRQVRCLR